MIPSFESPDHIARILIVDDERHNRRVLEVMLAPEGYLLLTAASGEDALALVAEQPPDLILLDIMMPGMDGYEVTRRIKGEIATKHIPVIMITVLDDRQARMLGLTAGAEDFLTKPVDRAELCARVKNLLRLKAYGDYHDKYSQRLEGEVALRTTELRHERDRAQRYLDTAGVMLVALDTVGTITAANRFACTVLGWTEAELLGRDWFDTCLVGGVRDEARAGLAHLHPGDPAISENRILTRGGAARLIEWRHTVLQDDDGTVTGSFSSGTDITERHQAVAALRSAEERMRFALEAAGVGIWDMDYTTRTLRWSAILESQYGLPAGGFGGTLESFVQRVHAEDRDAVRATFEKAAASGADFSVLNRSVWPDGSVHWLSGAGRYHLDAQGEPVRGVGISLDVTDRRELEQQYQQAQKMEAIGQLAGGVAHDFNNLLTVILGFCELLITDAEADDPRRGDLTEIHKAASSAASLTAQLLAFSRKQLVEPRVLDFNTVIADMGRMLQRLVGDDIAIVLRLAEELGSVRADPGQLHQVLMNLVVNASDSMPAGGQLTIETSNVDLDEAYTASRLSVAPGAYVVLAVSDTGTGMTPEVQAKLFEPFFTTKDQGKGTGLGLASVYGIVKQSRGSIEARSALGEGSTFRIFLPRVDDTAEPLTIVSVPALAPVTETILVVEDNPGVQALTAKILNAHGYAVLLAGSPAEAMNICHSHTGPIDLLLTDVVMPGQSGPSLAAHLTAERTGMRVLYMSGYATDAVFRRGGHGDTSAFLQKPFLPDALLLKIQGVLATVPD